MTDRIDFPDCPRCAAALSEREIQMDGWVGLECCCSECDWPDEPKRDFRIVSGNPATSP